ncbi:MAG: hypothetical protein HC919_13350 [Oscillatoriales cyanobacterium SM2_2_1]|nr:hypothetical protein [Oscillatoriales cyanobacterium SM2_2_1]
MSKTPSNQIQNLEDELSPEYRFDYQKVQSNQFAAGHKTQQSTVVVLDEDVAQVFTTPESVNKVLRALIKSMPQSAGSETT